MTRMKPAELTSGVGALVLGVGLGALFAAWVGPAAGFVMLAGVVAHAFGMWDKVAFGEVADGEPPKVWTTIPMRHVVQFLQEYLRQHWDVLRHAQLRDPALGVLALIEKWGIGVASS